MLLEVKGFIISETAYGETSKVINILTEDYGIIGIMAKGAKSMKSKLRSSVMKFTYGVFCIKYNKDKLSSLISVDIINPLKNIRNDLTLISYLNYISDLSYQVLKEHYEKEVFNLLISSVLKLEEGLDYEVITNILEIKLLDHLGVGLNLSECALCGNQEDIITIDASYGGLICKKCYTNSLMLDIKVIKLLRLYYYCDINTLTNINVKDNLKKDINLFLKNYYDTYTGLYIKSKEFIEKLTALS